MKKQITLQSVNSFFVGFIFAIGLGLAGMTEPHKIISFLDLKNWNPSLILVMIGAISFHALFYPLIRKRPFPMLDAHWHVPNRKEITARLIIGSSLFGMGWGLSGFCPGPALASLPASILSGKHEAILFVATMCLGMILFNSIEHKIGLKK